MIQRILRASAGVLSCALLTCCDGGREESEGRANSPVQVLEAASSLSPSAYDAYVSLLEAPDGAQQFTRLAHSAAPGGHFYAALGLKTLGRDPEYLEAVRLFGERSQVLTYTFVPYTSDGNQLGTPGTSPDPVGGSAAFDALVSHCARTELPCSDGVPLVSYINYVGE